MSLQVWLPLNGDLKNNGIKHYDITTLGTVSWPTEGKIGKCFQGGNGTQVANGISLNSNLTDILSNDYSIAVWIKPLGTHVHYNGAIISSGNWNQKTWSFGVSQDNTKVDVLSNRYNIYINCPIPVNIWTHLVCIRKNNVIKLYKNGEYIDSLSGSVPSAALQSNANNTTIGRQTYADGYFSFNGCINDLRIYDHALSLKQIKEISKGLVLHYPLNRQGLGQKNLLPCGGTYTQSSPWTTTLNRADGYAFVTNSGFEATPGKTYTISVECDGNLYSSHGGTHNPDDKHWTFWAYLSNIDTTKNWQNGGYDTPVNLTSRNNNYRKIGNTHVWTITLNSSQKYIGLRTNSYSDGNTDLTIHWWNMKVEEGDKFTGWSPNSIDSTIEYDCSGYCNNGTKMGTFEYTSDTPKYNISTVYTGSNYIYLNSPSTSEIRTLSLWVNWETIPSGQSVIFLDYASKLGLGLMSTGILCGTSGPGNYKTFSKTNLTANTWYHFVVINPDEEIGLNRKLYINGVEQSPTSSVSNWSYNVNQMQIGKRNSTSDGFVGKLSDLRLYSTVLSEADIKELYQTSVLIDRNQNLYVREVIE